MIPRSATFMRSLVELAGKQSEVRSILRTATYIREFEEKNKEDLDEAFTRIAAAARGGAVRMPLEKNDFLRRTDVALYMQQRGFEYSKAHGDRESLEWWAARKEVKRLD
jgi:hypothetical protein